VDDSWGGRGGPELNRSGKEIERKTNIRRHDYSATRCYDIVSEGGSPLGSGTEEIGGWPAGSHICSRKT